MKIINVADELIQKIITKKNPSVIGLDPNIEEIPDFLKFDGNNYVNPFEAIRDVFIRFNKSIIDAVKDIVPAVKPQIAYYEKYGSEGLKAFEETVKYAKQNGLVVIEDGKRNDIGSTAKAYADGHLGVVKTIDGKNVSSINVDYLTVSPYLGSDGLKPFIEVCKSYGKGIFILVKTSNPSSGELQNRVVESGKTIYEEMAHYVNDIAQTFLGESGYSPIGAVVGTTYPIEAEKPRKIMSKSIFLVPGYGAQGGKGSDVVTSFNDDGLGAIVNSSRDIIYAYSKPKYKELFSSEEFAMASRQAAIDMRDDIVRALVLSGKGNIYQ